MRNFLAIAALVLVVPPSLAAVHKVQNADGFRSAVAGAKPGDRILLAPGDYNGYFFFVGVHGAVGRPIVIAAANPDRPPRIIGTNLGIQFCGTSHLELCDLVFVRGTDCGLKIDDAGKFDKPSHHITFRNLRVSDIGPNGNADGIKLAGVDDFLIVDCTIERWGSGGSAIDMVGCHRGVVTRCQFKKGGDDGVQMKGGSSDIVVHKCLFENCGERAVNIGGFTDDEAFRPPLNTMPANGRYEVKNVRIEGCTFLGGKAAIAFIGADGASVRYNTFYLPEVYAIRILQEKAEAGFIRCRNGLFEHNLVVFRAERWGDGGVNIGPNTAPETFRFQANLWYCEDRPAQSQPRLPTVEKDGIIGKDPLFRDAVKQDFSVKAGSPAAKCGAHALPEE